MKRTQQNVLRILERSGRHRLTERQLTKLRSEKLLPKLKPGVKEGTNIPVNVWTQPNIVKHAAILHDLLAEWSHRHELLYLPLWILGFDVPFELVRELFLTRANHHLEVFTQGETDPDELGDVISSVAYQLLRHLRHDPRPANAFKHHGREYNERFLDLMLNMFANSTYEIDSQTLSFLFGSAPMTDFTEQNKPDDAAGATQELDPVYLNIAKVIQQVTSLSRVRDVMATASEKEWNQAREDFLELVAHACTAFSVSMTMIRETLTIPRWIMFNDLARTTLDEFDDFIEDSIASGKEWPNLVAE